MKQKVYKAKDGQLIYLTPASIKKPGCCIVRNLFKDVALPARGQSASLIALP